MPPAIARRLTATVNTVLQWSNGPCLPLGYSNIILLAKLYLSTVDSAKAMAT